MQNSTLVVGSHNQVTLHITGSTLALTLRRKHRVVPQGLSRELAVLVPDCSPLPLVGRKALLDGLMGWLTMTQPISVHALCGQAGSGKTRLGIELCNLAEGEGWAAGFLDHSQLQPVADMLATQSVQFTQPTLMVLDYAGQSHKLLARWIDFLAQQSPGHKVRLLLLEREAPEGHGWWHSLTQSALHSGLARGGVFAQPKPQETPGLTCLENRRQVLQSAWAAVQEGSSPPPGPIIPPTGQDPSFDKNLTQEKFANPLALVMAGVIAAHSSLSDALALHHLDMALRLARRELDRLLGFAGSDDVLHLALQHAAAFNSLTGGLALASLVPTLANELTKAGHSASAAVVADRLQKALSVSADGQHLATPQPDLIGEGFLITALGNNPVMRASAAGVAGRAYNHTPHNTAQVLMRLMQDYAYAQMDPNSAENDKITAEWLLGWLDELASTTHELQALVPLVSALPQHTLVLRKRALAFTQRLAKGMIKKASETNDVLDFVNVADSLNDLANRFSDLGQDIEAVSSAQTAVNIYRSLVAQHLDSFTPDLATSLNTLSISLHRLGRHDEALPLAKDAVDFSLAFAKRSTGPSIRLLAVSHTNLANILGPLGNHDEALWHAEEAVRLLRTTPTQVPAASIPDLANSLNTFAVILDKLGKTDAALQHIKEVIALYKNLAAQHPDAFTPQLAESLNNHALFLCRVRKYKDALTPAQEAVGVFRTLATQFPHVFMPRLAISLNNHAVLLSNLGQHSDALKCAQEAVSIRRNLVVTDSEAFMPSLARSLNTLANRFVILGQNGAALSSAQEAVTLFRTLATHHSEDLKPDWAFSLNTLANVLSALGQHDEALQHAQKGFDLCESLKKKWPGAYEEEYAKLQFTVNRLKFLAEQTTLTREDHAMRIRALSPAFFKTPQAFAGLMSRHLESYLALGWEQGQEPDGELITPVIKVFEKLSGISKT